MRKQQSTRWESNWSSSKRGLEGDLKTAFATLVQQRIGALVVAADPFLNGHTEQIVALAARASVPTISARREFVVAEGLMSYGTSISDAHRLAGIYAGCILKGARPNDLPNMRSRAV